MKLYSKNQWKEFQQSVIDLDGNKCTVCGKGSSETTLQVHHKQYIKGRKPWEYGTQDCVTLCKGCHAAEHGLIMPQFGWEYNGYEDLGDLSGTCEKCNTSIRYVFYIFHEKWGSMEVGTYCCDILTDTKVASNQMESMKSYEGRKGRFIASKRWRQDGNIYSIRQGIFDIQINLTDNAYFLTIHNLKSTIRYVSLVDAKAAAFRVIESGELVEYMKRNNIQMEEPKKRKGK